MKIRPNSTVPAEHSASDPIAAMNMLPLKTMRHVLARSGFGASAFSMLTMMNDWSLHMSVATDKQIDLARKLQNQWAAWLEFVVAGCPDDDEKRPILPGRHDRRFEHPGWSKPPFSALEQAFLLTEDYWDSATSDIPGLSKTHDKAMTFAVRQILDSMAPSNFVATNPEILEHTIEEKGANLARGGLKALTDAQDMRDHKKPSSEFVVGRHLAATPGRVVYRNHLIELIQYKPATKKVRPEPVLIVPAWIMKYYILDLSPENSLVRFLTEQGFTVFMISWRNPDAADRALGMDDYLREGPLNAIDHIAAQTGAEKIHAAGYCLGGTLLSIAAAAMARDEDERLASVTLFAAQTDFSEAGELTLFIDESQVSFLESLMDEQGFLSAEQMMSAFQMIRSNDLVWSRMIRSYLLGEDSAPPNDLMAWNADGTRMPANMHSQYLRHMFLNNDLARGNYQVNGSPVSLRDIRVPIFCVGTETDHIAPWKSVFKIHALTHSDVTFALTNGGHNAGVVSEPGHRHRHFRIRTSHDRDRYLGPDDWQEQADLKKGSWWPAWVEWLEQVSGEPCPPPKLGKSLGAAPGTYVLME
ncbi:MAG: alpha/beta fold hydrolase [Pseudomonadota bacterium]